MRIRLEGTRAECEHLAAVLSEHGPAAGIGVVREVSAFYANRPPSTLGRVYLDLEPGPAPPPGGCDQRSGGAARPHPN